MQDDATRDQFFEEVYPYLKDNYTYSIKEFSPLRATLAPIGWMGILLLAGVFLTWFAHIVQTQPVTRTMVVKAYVALIYKILKFIGPIPVVALTVIALPVCINYLVKRYKNPPVMMTIKKKED